MNRFIKVCISIIAVLTIVFLAMTIANYKKYQDVQLKRVNLQTENTALKHEKAETQKQLKELEVKLEEETRLKLSLQTELENATKEKDELSTSLEQVTQQLSQTNEEKVELEGRLKEIQVRLTEEKELFTKEAGKSETVIRSLETRFNELTQMIEARLTHPSVEKSGSQDQVKPKGRILLVDNKNDFVVTDLGEGDGVKEGDLFNVHNGDNFKGKAKVRKVGKEKSIASIIDGPTDAEIIEGDIVE